MKRNRLEYVNVGEELEFISWIRKWKDGHPHQKKRISSRNNKDQKGYLFITDEKKGKKSSPRMEWFCASVIVEILDVCWLLITWWSQEGKVDWWIKLQKLRTFKDKDNKQVLCWYYLKKLSFILNFLMPTIYSHIHLFIISNINQTWFRTCQEKWRYHFKNRDCITVSNIKYTKYYA